MDEASEGEFAPCVAFVWEGSLRVLQFAKEFVSRLKSIATQKKFGYNPITSYDRRVEFSYFVKFRVERKQQHQSRKVAYVGRAAQGQPGPYGPESKSFSTFQCPD